MTRPYLRLQVNNSGAWRNVVPFPAEDLDEMKGAAARLALLAYMGVKLRIVDVHDRVVAWWTPEDD